MMNVAAGRTALDTTRPLAIAVMAMGGQGGGVLVDWIVELCQAQGWVAQSTSVPGVAQRTGATVYYIETLPPPLDAAIRLRPVLSLMAVPGEVDVVIGAELMEAARAIQRGLVTPNRTTLIASSHRAYAVSEKQVPGDGIGNADLVYAAARASTKRFIAFDMEEAAKQSGSAISAVLFGALSASKALPFPRSVFEATIRAAGIGVEASLRAFALGFERADMAEVRWSAAPSAPAKRFPALQFVGHAAYDALIARARTKFPEPTHDMIAAGLQRAVDFQDINYGTEYLDLAAGMLAIDKPARDYAFTRTAAKYIAVAMAYDDVYRVADLKTRGSRFERVRAEVAATADQLVYTTEFMHPRMDEVTGSLPFALGRFIEDRPALFRLLDTIVNRGRRVKSGGIRWFVALYVLAGLKRFRRGTLRHAREVKHRDAWLARVKAAAEKDHDLAIEMLVARRLVKGYSDTHTRGQSKFDRIMDIAARLEGRADAADWVRRSREAALQDEEGAALSGVLKTIESFL